MRFFVPLVLLVFLSGAAWAGGSEPAPAYRSPEQIQRLLAGLASGNKGLVTLHSLALTPAGKPLGLLELGARKTDAPGILVLANMHGDSPPASEAALLLIEKLLGAWRPQLGQFRWYVLPVGNPDGYSRFFQRPLMERTVNGRMDNEDGDHLQDEDGPADLNGDGLISFMRQEHPEGRWLEQAGKPGLMRLADREKAERGRYRLMVEGRDGDADGQVAEDGPGGVDPGRNFPHRFQTYSLTSGRFPASEAEARAVMEFAYAHANIALVLVLGRANSLLEVPAGAGEASPGKDTYSLPKAKAAWIKLEPGVPYPVAFLVDKIREWTDQPDLSESEVLRFLGVGPNTHPDPRDGVWWQAVVDKYQAHCKAAGLGESRIAPEPSSPGSAEEWAYYQFGVPAFALDLWWDIEPKSAQEKREKAKEEQKAKAAGAKTPPPPDPVELAQKRRLAAEQALFAARRQAFAAFTPFAHPDLGPVEIGGRAPWSLWAPPMEQARMRIDKLLPFVLELVGALPRVSIARVEVKARGKGVWAVSAWVVNQGFFPYPTHQGQRSQRPSPIVVTATGKGLTHLEGRARVVLPQLEGAGGSAKARWLIRAKAGSALDLVVQGYAAGQASKRVVLRKGGK